MLTTAAIVVHAGAGLIALVTGLIAARTGRLFEVYWTALVVMALGLAGAVVTGWPDFGAGERVLFSAFVVLAAVMVWLGAKARELRPADSARPTAPYLDLIGFTLVALADAFAVVTVLDLGAPGWAVVGTGVALGLAGHVAIRIAKARLPDLQRQG